MQCHRRAEPNQFQAVVCSAELGGLKTRSPIIISAESRGTLLPRFEIARASANQDSRGTRGFPSPAR